MSNTDAGSADSPFARTAAGMVNLTRQAFTKMLEPFAGDAQFRNIACGTEKKRHMDILDTVDGHRPVGRLNFGSVFQVIEESKKDVGSFIETWLRVHHAGKRGWVLSRRQRAGFVSSSDARPLAKRQKTSGAAGSSTDGQDEVINCIKLADWQSHHGPIPAHAFTGHNYPHDGMYTEGYPGAKDICVVSASGDNMWRELNIEMLFRNISTATVFEKAWAGDADFTDWVAYYAFNVASHGQLSTGAPKHLIVTVKNTKNFPMYPQNGRDPDDLKDDLGKAQYKECGFLRKLFLSKGLEWKDVTFMTTFQFFQAYCMWSKKDCQNAAVDKARRIWQGDERTMPFSDVSWVKSKHIKDMVYWSLVEAFDDVARAEADEHWGKIVQQWKIQEQRFQKWRDQRGMSTFCNRHGFGEPLRTNSAGFWQRRNDAGETLWMVAARCGELLCIREMATVLQLDVNAPDEDGKTPIMAAAEHGHLECIRVLKDLGGSVNAQVHTSRETPMFFAAKSGHLECISVLKNLGADVHAQDSEGRSPLSAASTGGFAEAIRSLKGFGADIDSHCKDGKTPVFYAAEQGHVECLRALKDLGANINSENRYGKTAVFYAAEHGHVECILALKDLGANINQKDKRGRAAIHLADSRGHHRCVTALTQLGAEK